MKDEAFLQPLACALRHLEKRALSFPRLTVKTVMGEAKHAKQGEKDV